MSVLYPKHHTIYGNTAWYYCTVQYTYIIHVLQSVSVLYVLSSGPVYSTVHMYYHPAHVLQYQYMYVSVYCTARPSSRCPDRVILTPVFTYTSPVCAPPLPALCFISRQVFALQNNVADPHTPCGSEGIQRTHTHTHTHTLWDRSLYNTHLWCHRLTTPV